MKIPWFLKKRKNFLRGSGFSDFSLESRHPASYKFDKTEKSNRDKTSAVSIDI